MKSLVRTVDPTLEPVTLAEAQAFLRVDDTDSETDLINALIVAARESVENFTGRALLSQTWKLTMDAWPEPTLYRALGVRCDDSRTITLERSPLASVTDVKYYPASGAAQATLDAATYYHVLTGPTPGVIVLKSDQSWPDLYDRPDAVEVTFVAGVSTAAAVPKLLRQAVLLQIAHLYENRTPINIGNIVNELPYSLKAMLESHRVGGWVA